MMGRRVATWILLLLIGCAIFSTHCVKAQEGEAETGEAVDEDVEVYEEEDEEAAGDDGGEVEEYDDEYEEEEEEDDGELREASDVTTAVLFPDHPDQKFVAGEPVTVLIVFSNSGDDTYNVTHVGAHLHSPFDFSYYIQNFTVKQLTNVLVEGQSQVSLEYKFAPPENLEPVEYWLSGFVIYDNLEGRYYKSTYTNGTVDLLERPSDVNMKNLFTYFLLFAFVALIVVIGANVNKSLSKGKKSKVERGTKSASDNSWTADNVYTPNASSKARKRGGKRKSSKTKGNN